jgi:hypothetical protein
MYKKFQNFELLLVRPGVLALMTIGSLELDFIFLYKRGDDIKSISSGNINITIPCKPEDIPISSIEDVSKDISTCISYTCCTCADSRVISYDRRDSQLSTNCYIYT